MALKVIGTEQDCSVRYELNDLRPMCVPSTAANIMNSPAIPNLFFVIVEYLDGFLVLVLFDVGKYHEDGVQAFTSTWIDELEKIEVLE
eukprot:CAMPEP_0119324132 /NCGR_PEP_ID=MMETSP1333-20130426/62400_1 /TAXON_ID=418940 /ORGANISM="Scyphosphaera apsteinii, Strain RCC1455" /LENGTH=87 /DNA_ID=CAMNT_0007331751 /DNA_START=241 /DNA_END=504 /DNA_ORIENTATION=+